MRQTPETASAIQTPCAHPRCRKPRLGMILLRCPGCGRGFCGSHLVPGRAGSRCVSCTVELERQAVGVG